MSDKLDLIFDIVKSIDEKQDQQNERLTRLECHVEKNTESLDHHIKRTDLLEESLNKHKKADNARFLKLEEPRATVKAVGKFIVWMGGISTGLYGIYRLIPIIEKLF